jgi:hypothetical protein
VTPNFVTITNFHECLFNLTHGQRPHHATHFFLATSTLARLLLFQTLTSLTLTHLKRNSYRTLPDVERIELTCNTLKYGHSHSTSVLPGGYYLLFNNWWMPTGFHSSDGPIQQAHQEPAGVQSTAPHLAADPPINPS